MILEQPFSKKSIKNMTYLTNLQIYFSVKTEVKQLKTKLRKIHKKTFKQNSLQNQKHFYPENFIIILKYDSYTELHSDGQVVNIDCYLGFFKDRYMKLTARYPTDQLTEQADSGGITWEYDTLPDQAVFNILADRITLYNFRLFVSKLGD